MEHKALISQLTRITHQRDRLIWAAVAGGDQLKEVATFLKLSPTRVAAIVHREAIKAFGHDVSFR